MVEACSLLIVYEDTDLAVCPRRSVFLMFQNETGRLQLEGCVCDDYYRVRELLYEQFAIV